MKHIKLFENWFNNRENSIYENFLSPSEHLEFLDVEPSVTQTSQSDVTPNNSISGNCTTFVEKTTDRFSGDSFIASKQNIIVSKNMGKTGFGITMFKEEKDIRTFISFTIVKNGRTVCIEKRAEMIILFTDNTKKTYSSFTKFNCKGSYTLAAYSQPSSLKYSSDDYGIPDIIANIEELKTKKIQAIRVQTSDGYIDEDFTLENQSQFFNTINCIS